MKRILVGATFAVLALASCATPQSQPSDSPSSTSASPSPTQCWKSPLTGLCADETSPVVVAKIDDVSGARPQYGLMNADLTIIEPVEGGLTRLMAVFASDVPTEVGPIRSARITDIDLVPMFGKPGFAYSGSASKLVPYLEDGSLQLIGHPQGGTGYIRIDTHAAPHNLVGVYSELIGRIGNLADAQLSPTLGWNFAETPTLGRKVVHSVIKWPSAERRFVWDETLQQWGIKVYKEKLMTAESTSAALEQVFTTTVYIMETELLDSEFGDSNGNATPYAQTFGEGTGWVLSHGEVIQARWERKNLTDLPQWFTLSGSPIAVLPGKAWLAIVDDRTEIDFKYVTSSTSPSPSSSATPSATKS